MLNHILLARQFVDSSTCFLPLTDFDERHTGFHLSLTNLVYIYTHENFDISDTHDDSDHEKLMMILTDLVCTQDGSLLYSVHHAVWADGVAAEACHSTEL